MNPVITHLSHPKLFALVALLLALFLFAALPALAQDTPTPDADDATEEATPFLQPTLPASPTPYCPHVPRNRLIINERGRVSDEEPTPLNIREGPQTSFEILDEMPAGEIFFVLEGPRCSERYAWYRIRYGEIEGWIAEGTGDVYFVEPYLPG